MNRVLLVAGALALFSCSVFAGGYFMNDTGETVHGLRVEFSEPVTITGFGDVLTTIEPLGESTTFAFSGGAVQPWGDHWVIWEPASASIVGSEWLRTPPSSSGNPTAGGSSSIDSPIVEGEPLNASYFAHGACVMQGIDDPDEIFAMPLLGVEELSFWPTSDGTDPTSVTWRIEEITTPEGISAEIRDDTLYIWGHNPTWVGYGEVILSATIGDESVSVAIPVTVFGAGKTLVNAQGKKDYFVPWSPQLDINRILSVQEHMRTYNKDEGNLDRTIQWSRWKKMWNLKDVTKSTFWYHGNEFNDVWTWESQMRHVDVFLDELAELGVGLIRVEHLYYIQSLYGSTIAPIYRQILNNAGTSMRPEEIAYFVNEAHRNGIQSLLSPGVGVLSDPGDSNYYEIWQAAPADFSEYWASYEDMIMTTALQANHLGAEILSICTSAELVGPETWENRERTSSEFERIASLARNVFQGPLTAFAGKIGEEFPHPRKLVDVPFWGSLDILSMAVNDGWHPLASRSNPSYSDMLNEWRSMISMHLQPFQKEWNKPYIAYENGCTSFEDGMRWYAYGPAHFEGREDVSYELDIAAMRLYYESFIEAFANMEGFFGAGWYRYNFSPYGSGGIHDGSMMPRLKADDILQAYYTGQSMERIVVPDDSVSEWRGEWQLVTEHTAARSTYGDNMTSAWGIADEKYVYIRVDYEDEPQGTLDLTLDVDGDSNADYRITVYRGTRDASGHDIEYWDGRISSCEDWNDSRYGNADVARADSSLEIRIHRRYLEALSCLSILEMIEYTRSWSEEDRIAGPLHIEGVGTARCTSPLLILQSGRLREPEDCSLNDSAVVVGSYTGEDDYTPYLKTSPEMLLLNPCGTYEVCFDYEVAEPGLDGFEILFLSPTGARSNNWVESLRVGVGGEADSGHACLTVQLDNYSDYEIRWNVVSTGSIAIDNVMVWDLDGGEIILEEDFEDWE